MKDSQQRHHKPIRLKCIVLGAAGAGKTSLLRRYFHQTFDPNRRPTLGSDFYSAKISVASDDGDSSANSHSISLHVWDTAGKERKATYATASLGNEFFVGAHAAMLVYDATSSTSFTQLLKWHSNLLERSVVPVLIVANKQDVIIQRKQQEELQKKIAIAKIAAAATNNESTKRQRTPYYYSTRKAPPPRKALPPRQVLGLDNFRGKDWRYEYRVSSTTDDSANTTATPGSTYLATHGGDWTVDHSYLDSVLGTEDSSHPDRDMVLIWCMRNGLQHKEASALNGDGVKEAMQALQELALKQYHAVAAAEAAKNREDSNMKAVSVRENNNRGKVFAVNSELDLHKRYAPKEEECCNFLPSWGKRVS